MTAYASPLERAIADYGDWRLIRWGEWLAAAGLAPIWAYDEETPPPGSGAVIPAYEAMEVEVVLMRAPRYQEIARVHYYMRPRMRWGATTCYAMAGHGKSQYYEHIKEACLLVASRVGPAEMRGCLEIAGKT